MKKFYDALKTICGINCNGSTTLLRADGSNLLTDTHDILEIWAENYKNVPNRPSSIGDGAVQRLPQIERNVLLNEFPIVLKTRKTFQQPQSGKAPGADAILLRFIRRGEKLIKLFTVCCYVPLHLHSFEIICRRWNVGLEYHMMRSFYKYQIYSINTTISDIPRQGVIE